jgi:hypothetical protein
LTVTGATLVAGDLVEVTSTWSKISNRIWRGRKCQASGEGGRNGCDGAVGGACHVMAPFNEKNRQRRQEKSPGDGSTGLMGLGLAARVIGVGL